MLIYVCCLSLHNPINVYLYIHKPINPYGMIFIWNRLLMLDKSFCSTSHWLHSHMFEISFCDNGYHCEGQVVQECIPMICKMNVIIRKRPSFNRSLRYTYIPPGLCFSSRPRGA